MHSSSFPHGGMDQGSRKVNEICASVSSLVSNSFGLCRCVHGTQEFVKVESLDYWSERVSAFFFQSHLRSISIREVRNKV